MSDARQRISNDSNLGGAGRDAVATGDDDETCCAQQCTLSTSSYFEELRGHDLYPDGCLVTLKPGGPSHAGSTPSGHSCASVDLVCCLVR